MKHWTFTFKMKSVQGAAAAPVIPILMSLLLYTQSSGQRIRGWIIYIRCQGLSLWHTVIFTMIPVQFTLSVLQQAHDITSVCT